ncbi:hypothetical protein IHE45_09G028400 [Dioscorea alata]|uniref:Uncharacterized protein n=1 Tax=Dioscorea alata TaxID=55571 RepID=A0ACB7VE62_DIOAL|nr:hypothetical protein IHE45_09G028400 [Dioscorea alata]
MAKCAIRNADANALRDAAHKEVQEKKKLLNQVIFNIDGLSEDEALVVIQSLRKDEEKLNMFWDLLDDKKLRFCRLLLGGRDII